MLPAGKVLIWGGTFFYEWKVPDAEGSDSEAENVETVTNLDCFAKIGKTLFGTVGLEMDLSIRHRPYRIILDVIKTRI